MRITGVEDPFDRAPSVGVLVVGDEVGLSAAMAVKPTCGGVVVCHDDGVDDLGDGVEHLDDGLEGHGDGIEDLGDGSITVLMKGDGTGEPVDPAPVVPSVDAN
jgi:hypothetical protein